MHIKKFEAATMAEAIVMVKDELGPDAVILSTKSTKKGLSTFGIFGAPSVEVTAALDRSVAARERGTAERPAVSGNRDIQPAIHNMEDIGALRDDIKDLRGLIEDMNKAERRGPANLPERLKGIYSGMLSAGVSSMLAVKLLKKSAARCGKEASPGRIKEVMADYVMDAVKVSGGLDTGKGRCVAFVGPTGVGKTTTLAKLAARYSMKGKDVAMITIDTYRIGAVEQLKIYAKMLKVPVAVASSPRELREKVAAWKDKDLILIDTAGRSHRDDSQISFLREFFPPEDDSVELHLLLSATTKESDTLDIIKRFGVLPVTRYLFTKLDESSSFGTLLNISCGQERLPYSYFTTGQKVPEDMELATPERVADLILKISNDMTGKDMKCENQRRLRV